jgi:hypothetical protein
MMLYALYITAAPADDPGEQSIIDGARVPA